MKNKIWLILILVVGPLLFMYPLTKGKTNTHNLQYFGKTEELAKTTEIKDFSFITLDSTLLTKETTEGKTLIVSTLFPTCPTDCPIVLRQLKFIVYDKLVNDENIKDLLFISHLINTDGSTPDLKTFVSEQDIDEEVWQIVTGSENPIYDIDMPIDTITGISRNLLRDNANGVNFGGKTYYKVVLLIDKYLKVRGVYQGDQTPQLETLRIDVRNLYNEYKKENKTNGLTK